jgi:hypothetical protein
MDQENLSKLDRQNRKENLPVSSSVKIYFSCRRSAEIFPEYVCKIKVKFKTAIFVALEGALCRAFFDKSDLFLWGGIFLIESELLFICQLSLNIFFLLAVC